MTPTSKALQTCALTATTWALLLAASACSKLSSDARPLVGNYYIAEISNDDPLYELRDDATCTIRAIRPGVLTYCVEGQWNVYGDSLIVDVDPSTLTWEGDSSLIGEIAPRYSRRIVDSDELSLTVEKEGISYVYHRRPQ